MLTFVGLGLYDAGDISVKGLEAVRASDAVFLEYYTSRLMGTTIEDLVRAYGKEVIVLARADVEQHPEPILDAAAAGDVVVLTGGDPMVSTTHMDLRLRAAARGIPTGIIHGASIQTAVCGLTGLQNYRFGKSCSVPFPQKNWFPLTPYEVVRQNLAADLHTLVYLDIQQDRYMRVGEAIDLLEEMAVRVGGSITTYIGVARAGSVSPVVRAGTADHLRGIDFGGPLHVLIVPATLHPVEQEYLEVFAGLSV
ncbi:diphthine synthase [Methanosphaerula palustris]|uniref:Diphthine synthase n=1 Tax=Methanosphaerula palustris (strain ATCC BAA-1556 / DSM 19958 / E1-9c) TaxID=521011 RepID=DPHB_METPE|nr:diphthine synthase [Methanosphaerula palustris]B8GIF8.1 RecName: Full=Diphthine synthase; AltName: Full=Diphthamide biosynthesis methyltransferase [Methanosphaerula palustris E1-9c]ACL15509.1 diphthine synthase [Methanosphaerula palustris E1-9c]